MQDRDETPGPSLENCEDWRIFPPVKYDFWFLIYKCIRLYKCSRKLKEHNNPVELQYSPPFHI